MKATTKADQNIRLFLILITAFSVHILNPQVNAQEEFFNLPPINYTKATESNPVTKLRDQLKAGNLRFQSLQGTELLREILAHFDIPEESQVLVFSKTSKQINYIFPRAPRSIYFNDHIYVGHAIGGSIEITYIDSLLGALFYVLKPDVDNGIVIERDDSCLSCHGGSRNNGVPGIFIRSVTPDKEGHPIAGKADFQTTTSSPISERWGGWYVTGDSGQFHHLGNSFFGDGRTSNETQNIHDLSAFFDTEKYLQPTSDILALMLLEHQCTIQNIFTKASLRYQRSSWLSDALSSVKANKPSSTSPSSLDRSTKNLANDIVAALLFKDEFDLDDDGIQGSPAFQQIFESKGKRDAKGRSLRDLRLFGRLFKYRCSYMIYSPSFSYIPKPIRDEVYAQLKNDLTSGEGNASHIKKKERGRILEILEETLTDF